MREKEVKEMTVNDGCITNRGKDRRGRTIWEIEIPFGRDPATGKRIRKTARVHGTKADARAMRDKMRSEYGNGLALDADKLTLADYARDYLAARRVAATVLPETVDTQEQHLREICRILGDEFKLRDVTPLVVQSLYPKLEQRIKARNAGKCSSSTLRKYHVTLSACLKAACRQDLILRNPCERVEAPKTAKPNRRSLTADEAARLLKGLDKAEAEAYATMDAKEGRRRDPEAQRASVEGLPELSGMMAVRIGLATGMRLGEVLALDWGNVDTVRCVVRVAAGMSKSGRVKEPKTDAGSRLVHIDAKTARHLARWHDAQAALLATLGMASGDATPVSCSRVGTRLGRATFDRCFWHQFRESCGLGGLRFHELRHTQATQLLANGIDVKTVQTRMGHSNASITLNWYAHAVPENDRAAADMLGSLFAGGGKAPDDGPQRGRIIELKTA